MRIISGVHRSRLIESPKGKDLTRPTPSLLRKVFFDSIAPYIEDSVFLDLFAGSGVMGLEAISRGSSHAYFIEKNYRAANCIKANITQLKCVEQSTLLVTDAIKALNTLSRKSISFDIIYIDPPYDLEYQSEPISLYVLKVLKGLDLIHSSSVIGLETNQKQNLASITNDWNIIKSKSSGDAKLTILKLL